MSVEYIHCEGDFIYRVVIFHSMHFYIYIYIYIYIVSDFVGIGRLIQLPRSVTYLTCGYLCVVPCLKLFFIENLETNIIC